MVEPIANVGVEQAILGTMLTFNEAAKTFAPTLVASDFAFTEHVHIFEAIAAAVNDNRGVSPSVIAPHFAETKILGIPGPIYLVQLVSRSSVPVRDMHWLVRELRDYSGRRSTRLLGEHIAAVSADPSTSIADLCAQSVGMLDDIAATVRLRRQTTFDVGEIAAETLARLKSKEKREFIKTGLLDLDRMLGGWHRGELTIIGGRPSMGKSALVQSLALQGAKHGTRTLIFSLEMRRDAVVNRMISDAVWNTQSPISYKKISDYDLTEYEIERIERATEKFAEMPIRIDDQTGLAVTEIAARSRRYVDEMDRKGKRVDVIAVDHIGKIAASNRYAGNPTYEIGETVNALFNLGRELEVAMVAATQLNRGNEKRENRRAEMSDGRGSGDLEQDADNMMLPYRASYYLERKKEDDADKETDRLKKLDVCKNTIEINIAKNRNGPIVNLEFFCDMASNVIRDMVK